MPERAKGPDASDVYEQLRPIIGAHDHAAVRGVLDAALTCPTCGSPTIRVCQACIGRRGGQQLTDAKKRQLKQARQQLKKTRAARKRRKRS
jgi:hypothetical protein